MKKIITQLLDNIKKAPSENLYQEDFLLTWEKSLNDIKNVLYVADALKILRESDVSTRCFDSGIAVSQFRDNSTRTRFAFASACNLLGLNVQDLDEGKSQISHGETVRETSNMISFMTEIIGIRDDMYLGAGNTYMREVGDSLGDGYKNGILAQRPGIVNLQCDIDHPTQTMADLMHLKNHFGSLENLKGKKIAMTWAYSPSYGKPLSVPQGIIGLLTRFGMDVHLAFPETYDLIPEVVNKADTFAKQSGGNFKVTDSIDEAFKDADIVYPKSWAPFSVMERRTEYLRKNDHDSLKWLEKECLASNAVFKTWECTEEKMKLTKEGNALYLHCLPADISGVSCQRGEVQKEVFEKYRIDTYKQASNKPYIIAAMILTNRFVDPLSVLRKMIRSRKRRLID